jgi:hypothetical protein
VIILASDPRLFLHVYISTVLPSFVRPNSALVIRGCEETFIVKVTLPRRTVNKARAVKRFDLIGTKDEMHDSFNLRNF